MTTRITDIFAKTRAEKRAALITFVMGYDPDAKTAGAILNALPKADADIIEIGIPFSDPMADGPTIQAAGLRALKAGATLKNILALVKQFRTSNNATPIILMGYYNPIYRYGIADFCKDAAEAGVDGLIIVDLPPEEEGEITAHVNEHKLSIIRLIAPTSDDARLPALTASANGFIYYISVAGITGANSMDAKAVKEKIAHLRKFTKLPIAVGFGIKTPQAVSQAAEFADAVVVGSALVEVIHKAGKQAAEASATFVSELAKGLTHN